jgi:hypothetical protein
MPRQNEAILFIGEALPLISDGAPKTVCVDISNIYLERLKGKRG